MKVVSLWKLRMIGSFNQWLRPWLLHCSTAWLFHGCGICASDMTWCWFELFRLMVREWPENSGLGLWSFSLLFILEPSWFSATPDGLTKRLCLQQLQVSNQTTWSRRHQATITATIIATTGITMPVISTLDSSLLFSVLDWLSLIGLWSTEPTADEDMASTPSLDFELEGQMFGAELPPGTRVAWFPFPFSGVVFGSTCIVPPLSAQLIEVRIRKPPGTSERIYVTHDGELSELGMAKISFDTHWLNLKKRQTIAISVSSHLNKAPRRNYNLRHDRSRRRNYLYTVLDHSKPSRCHCLEVMYRCIQIHMLKGMLHRPARVSR